MKNKNKLHILVLLISISITFKVNAQDIFNLSNSKKYAEYLYKNKEYKRASIELERICYIDSLDWESRLLLMKSYTKNKNYNLSVSTYLKNETLFPDSLKNKFKHQFYISQFKYNFNYFSSDTFQIKQTEDYYFKIPSLLLSNNLTKSKIVFSDKNLPNNNTIVSYRNLYNDALRIKYKNKWLAATMSALLPGAGKVYTGYYKDGIMAFLFTGLSAYQAYRGYTSKGVNSGIFLIYSSVTAGFYLGNIYGSFKSAKQRNKLLSKKIQDKTNIIFDNWAE